MRSTEWVVLLGIPQEREPKSEPKASKTLILFERKILPKLHTRVRLPSPAPICLDQSKIPILRSRQAEVMPQRDPRVVDPEQAAPLKVPEDAHHGALEHSANLAGLQVREPLPAQLAILLVPGGNFSIAIEPMVEVFEAILTSSVIG